MAPTGKKQKITETLDGQNFFPMATVNTTDTVMANSNLPVFKTKILEMYRENNPAKFPTPVGFRTPLSKKFEFFVGKDELKAFSEYGLVNDTDMTSGVVKPKLEITVPDATVFQAMDDAIAQQGKTIAPEKAHEYRPMLKYKEDGTPCVKLNMSKKDIKVWIVNEDNTTVEGTVDNLRRSDLKMVVKVALGPIFYWPDGHYNVKLELVGAVIKQTAAPLALEDFGSLAWE